MFSLQNTRKSSESLGVRILPKCSDKVPCFAFSVSFCFRVICISQLVRREQTNESDSPNRSSLSWSVKWRNLLKWFRWVSVGMYRNICEVGFCRFIFLCFFIPFVSSSKLYQPLQSVEGQRVLYCHLWCWFVEMKWNEMKYRLKLPISKILVYLI